jgi:sugar/nucleoside kinase (ribokinase family)
VSSLLSIRGEALHVLPHKVESPLDTCGVGDTFLSAFSCAIAAGASREEAGQLAFLASEIIIGKVGETGTATADEIIARFEKAYLII